MTPDQQQETARFLSSILHQNNSFELEVEQEPEFFEREAQAIVTNGRGERFCISLEAIP